MSPGTPTYRPSPTPLHPPPRISIFTSFSTFQFLSPFLCHFTPYRVFFYPYEPLTYPLSHYITLSFYLPLSHTFCIGETPFYTIFHRDLHREPHGDLTYTHPIHGEHHRDLQGDLTYTHPIRTTENLQGEPTLYTPYSHPIRTLFAHFYTENTTENLFYTLFTHAGQHRDPFRTLHAPYTQPREPSFYILFHTPRFITFFN